MDVQTQVIKFFAGQTQSANPRQKWDVYLADGKKVTAWEYAVAAKAEQAWKSGETITAQITEKPNPNGGNPYLNLTGVILGASNGQPAQAAQITQNGTGGAQKPLGGFSGGMTPEDKIRVTKLSCISSAAAIFSGSGDVGETLKAAAVIFNEVWAPKPASVASHVDQVALGVATDAPLISQAVQQFVNAEVGAPVVGVGVEKPALPWAVA